MSSLSAPSAEPAPRYRFSVAEYEHLVDAGLFHDRRVELLNGDVVLMPPMNPPHWAALHRLQALLHASVPPLRLLVQMPVIVPDDGEPEPDVAVLRPEFVIGDRKPLAADLVLAVEVAESSFATDRDVKAPLYARAGVPEVWLVDVTHREVWQLTQPSDAGYARSRRVGLRGTLAPTALPGTEVSVAAIFGQ